MYSEFVESLKRLYEDEQVNIINKNKIDELFQSKKITEEEKNYILGKG